jgi:hypothetical protein
VSSGAALVVLAMLVGGAAAGAGGVIALVAQVAAVALLRPAMKAPQPVFFQRWLAGMGVRLTALVLVVAIAATHRRELPPLEMSLGFLGVLLPLLFLETRFLR